ncbi:hypothetical protein [Helicobacter burdigaliensis]|uniref:hypothetical protein n=1 Tax=Helicobacter burdigaliensis TaxID=2315334 RepID=UPI000EF6CC3C|nr:hypothetical protein [Helicobacter burdigaliensis]
MVNYFSLNEIIFYSLELEAKEEDLQDLLEEKICLILGLNRECEYFLSYCYKDKKYHCVLINKDELENDYKNTSFLTSPIFVLQALYTQKGLSAFILEESEKLALLLVEDSKIIFYELLKLEEIYSIFKKQKEPFNLYYFSLDKEYNEKILELQNTFNQEIKFIKNCFKKEELEKKNVPNFSPQKSKLEIFKKLYFRYFLLFFVSFLLCFMHPLYFLISNLILENKNQEISHNLQALNLELNLKNEKKSNEEKAILKVKEELQNLKQVYLKNKEYLSSINPQKTYFLSSFMEINGLFLEKNIKIAFLNYRNKKFSFLLFGEGFYSLFPQIEKYAKVLDFSDISPYYYLHLEAK